MPSHDCSLLRHIPEVNRRAVHRTGHRVLVPVRRVALDMVVVANPDSAWQLYGLNQPGSPVENAAVWVVVVTTAVTFLVRGRGDGSSMYFIQVVRTLGSLPAAFCCPSGRSALSTLVRTDLVRPARGRWHRCGHRSSGLQLRRRCRRCTILLLMRPHGGVRWQRPLCLVLWWRWQRLRLGLRSTRDAGPMQWQKVCPRRQRSVACLASWCRWCRWCRWCSCNRCCCTSATTTTEYCWCATVTSSSTATTEYCRSRRCSCSYSCGCCCCRGSTTTGCCCCCHFIGCCGCGCINRADRRRESWQRQLHGRRGRGRRLSSAVRCNRGE